MRRHWRLLAFLLLLGAGLYALLATPLGLRLAWQVARTYAPGELQVQRLEGRWLGPMHLQGLRYRQADRHHVIEELWLDWRPGALLRGTLEISELGIQGVRLELDAGRAAPEPEAGTFIPDFRLPLGLRIGSLDIRELRIERGGEALLQLDHLHLEARTEADRLQLGTLELVLPQGRLQLSGSVGLGAETPTDLDLRWSAQVPGLEPLKGKARLSGDWGRLQLAYQVQEPAPANLQLQLADPFGKLRWSASLQLPEVELQRFSAAWPALRLAADLDAEGDLHQASLRAGLETDAGAETLYPLKLQARARAGDDGWRLEQARLEQPDSGGVLEAQGRGVYGGSSELQLQWRTLSWPPPPAAVLAASPAGRLDWSGTPAAWRYRLEGRLQGDGAPELDLRLAGSGDQTQMRLETLHLALLDGSLEGEGSVHWRPEPRWDLALRAVRLDPGAWFPDWPGRLAAQLQLTGGLREGVPHNRLQLARLEGRLRGQALQGRGTIVQEGDTFGVDGLELRSGAALFALEGRLAGQWQADWRLDIPDLATLLPGGQGRLAGQGHMDGPRLQPRVQARLEGAGLAWESQAVGTLDLDLDWDAVGRWDLRLDAADLRSGAGTLASLKAGVAGSQADHRIELEARNADTDLALALTGAWREGEWRGRITQADWRHATLGPWTLRRPAGLRASAAGGALEPLCWQREDSGLCLEGAGHREQGWVAELDLERLPLAWLEAFLPLQRGVETRLDARLETRLNPAGRPQDGRLELALSPGRLILGPAEEQVLAIGGGRLRGRLADGRAELGLDLALAGNDRLRGDWVITAIDTDTPQLDGRLQGDVQELALVEAFTQEVERVQGRLQLDIRARGALADPELTGRLSLEEGAATVPAAGIRLEALQLALETQADGRIRLTGRVRSGREGELRLEGELREVRSPDRRLRLRLQGERFLVVDTTEYQVRLDPDLVLEVDARRVDLTGEVRIPYARLRPRDFSGAVAPSRDVVLVGAGVEHEPPSPWRIHSTVQLYLGDDVQVNGFGLRGFLGGSMRLREEPERPATARGVLAIRDGRYRAYGQDLRIDTGRLLFTDSPLDNPGLDIRAARHVRNVVAGIRVTGQLRDPSLSLYSEPAMSESDTLSYLLFGRPLQSASQAEGATMMQAASALGLGGSGLLAAQIGEAFGFDEVEIGGGSGEGFGEAALLVGKYLSPRLYVQYGVGLLEPVSTFRVRYEMSRRWTLQTETGVESGADLLYTLD